jgi:ABC-type multidrug transport system ATPase subunit
VLLVRRLLADLKAEGVTILFNSHQLDQVERVSDRVLFLREGRLADVPEGVRLESLFQTEGARAGEPAA